MNMVSWTQNNFEIKLYLQQLPFDGDVKRLTINQGFMIDTHSVALNISYIKAFNLEHTFMEPGGTF